MTAAPTADPTSDPVAVIESLDPAAIADRLADLDSQARALRELLRVARIRQSGRPVAAGDKREGRRDG